MKQRAFVTAGSLVVLLAGQVAFAQPVSPAPAATVKLQELQQRFKAQAQLDRAAAAALAARFGIEPRRVLPNGKVLQLQRVDPAGRPVFYITNNYTAAESVSTDEVWPGGSAGLNLTGSGLVIGEWDAGAVAAAHPDFTGRVQQIDDVTEVSGHSTHVAGTLIGSGAGLYLQARGMAYQADLHAYDWVDDAVEMAAAADAGMLVSNHSYGIAAGWLALGGTPPDNWWWFGGLGADEDPNFGYYNDQARAWDEIAYYAPNYLIVKAAGNDRWDVGPEPDSNESFRVVDQDGVEIAVSSDAPPPDCGQDSYDCLPPGSVAKNILSVGAVDDVPGGYTPLAGPSGVRMTGFSSWGPADDGRIKPDLVANGWMLFSTFPPNTYASAIGTSMAAPNASGSLLLLQQHYANLNGGAAMRAATLKGLAIHTADEAGDASGPDYEYGWGLLNTREAARVISDNGAGVDWIVEGSLGDGNTDTLVINVSQEGARVTATLVWHDPPATPVPADPPVLDPSTLMLVNDLDLRATSNGDTHLPWRLEPGQPAAPATRADNFRDNVEQVEFTASAGNYTLSVSHKGVLTAPQDYSLLVSIKPPAPVAGGLTIDEDFAEGILPPGWTTWTTNVPWTIQLPDSSDVRYQNNTGGSGGFAMMDNKFARTEAALVMPPLDFSQTQSAVLRFLNFKPYFDEQEWLYVETSTDGGASWSVAWSYYGASFLPFQTALNLTAELAGQADARIRFRFSSGGYRSGDYWQVDNVELETVGAQPPPPPPEPSGLPGLSDDPVPNSDSTDVSTSALLTWSAGALAESHKVYLGTSSSLGPGNHRATVTTNQYDPGPLAGETTYFWRVDEVNTEGETQGNTWQFTTGVAPEPPPAPEVHVADIDGSSTPQSRNRWQAAAAVRLVDQDGLPVQGAEVVGDWSNGTNGSVSTTTDNNGIYTLAKGNLKAGVSSVTFTVTAVNLAGHTYTPAANTDPDGDSDGTVIVIQQDGGGAPTNTPPVVVITAPTEGEVFPSGGTVPLQAGASDAEDADTDVTAAIVWREGGNIIGSGGSTSHVFASDGSYSITATTTDSGGESHADTVSITVGDGGSGGASGVYVNALNEESVILDDRRWSARARVTVFDDDGEVAGATVNGSWSNGAKGSASCNTGADGSCVLSKSLKQSVGSVLLTVDSVSVGGINHPPGNLSTLPLSVP